MYSPPHSNIILAVLLLLFYTQLARGRPQAVSEGVEDSEPIRNGRYVPEVHGAERGKYVPDESGKYHHVFVPYDGGYGDRGQMYVHDEPPPMPLPHHPNGRGGLQLGPKDHLRFSIDFNYDGSGWQIVQFEWINDDDAKMRYDYTYRNQLWPADSVTSANAQSYDGVGDDKIEYADPSAGDENNTSVHVSGEYQGDIYNVKYSNDNAQSQPNIQTTIYEVLEYIQTNVLPTLK